MPFKFKYLWILLFFSLQLSCFAQGHDGLYCNEWIDFTPGKKYYKIKIHEDGMYRLNGNILQQSGIDINTINASNYQLFHNGNEIPIHVALNNGNLDYIQFYGQKNRGEFDVHLYNDPDQHYNPNYSLYNDTASYYLTWGNSASTMHFESRAANLTNLPAPESYHMYESKVSFTNNWNPGYYITTQGTRLYKSLFEYGEGYGSNDLNGNFDIDINTNHVVTNGPAASASVRMASHIAGSAQISLQVAGTSYSNSNYTTPIVGDFDASIPPSALQNGNTTLRVNASQYSISNASITYPKAFDFDGKFIDRIKIEAGNSRKLLQIANFDANNSAQNKFYIYDLTNKKRIQCFYTGVNSTLLTDLNPSSIDHDLIIINESNAASIKNVSGLSQVNFVDYTNATFFPTNYVIISHSILTNSSNGQNPIFEYQAYRQSLAGGAFVTTYINIQQLYEQFAYGINSHPLAIRNFVHFIKSNWNNPEYVLLIGKARDYIDIRNSFSNQLVPTFGHPSSDNYMLGRVNQFEPEIAVGRISATNGDQVLTYLNKIKDTEASKISQQTLLDKGWTKKILHLGGGKTSGEQNLIRYNLDNMKAKLESTFMGASVESFFKTSTTPIQVAQSTYLDSIINDGVAMISFFGHSSANGFDFNLDHPQNYNNFQKYPLIMALGCYSGTIFKEEPKISEDFIFEPEAGAGVFLASVGAGELNALNVFSQNLCNALSKTFYNEGAAKSVKEAIRIMESSISWNNQPHNQMTANYITYHGDPAYKISTADDPDYYIDKDLVSHYPDYVTLQDGTFYMELDIYNIGKAIDTVFNIKIDRVFPNGDVEYVTTIQINAPLFNTKTTIPLDVGNTTALGINKFNIYIDSDNDIDERPNPDAENNNIVLEYEVPIFSDAIVPVYPYEFAIVPESPVTLKASTGNSFASLQNYIIQIDTTEYFNSPLFQTTSIAQIGGLLEWTPNIVFQDSTVYYWRVSIDSVSPASPYFWETSSFIYLNGSFPGWNQSHFFQFLKDSRINLELNEPDRAIRYITSIQTVSANTSKTPDVMHPNNVAVYFNGSKLEKCRCETENGMYVVVIEPGTLNFWELPGPYNNQQFGAYNCDNGNRPTPMYLFKTYTTQGRNALYNFIKDTIPDGHYVLAFSLNNSFVFSWDSLTLRQIFKDNDAVDMDFIAANSSANNYLPWATFFKKSDTTYVHNVTVIGASENDVVAIAGQLEEDWYQGSQKSTLIGPVTSWGSFHWDHDNFPNDEQSVEIYGVDADQNVRTLLYPNSIVPIIPDDLIIDNIDASLYPYLELVWYSLDSVENTSPQLEYWRVLADMVPEAALRPEYHLYFDSTVVQKGQELVFEIAMENISPVDMDSMLVKFQILGTSIIQYTRLDSLHAGDTLNARVRFPTVDLDPGMHQLLVEINPDDDQPEKYFFNNIGSIQFEVKKDEINPILDVTFDGVHIMNKDIVSGKPEIIITLTDDNQYLGLDDLNDFSIILRHGQLQNGEIELKQDNTDIQFYPSDIDKLDVENKAKIVMHPEFEYDGLYSMFVSATDKTGNNSGELSYNIDFEVINKASISNVFNYPNPFSTATHFVFTLTGNSLPDYMKIQILTVSGKVVREITQEELGPLKIGVNKTEYAWDGKDEFGQQLANGVYLYRVITKKDNSVYDIYSQRTDYMFRQGFGKMYLMR